MSDYSELKKLAEAAPEGPWFGPEYAPNTGYVFDNCLGSLLHYESIEYEQESCLRFVAAANPAAVLALIAENKSLKGSCKALGNRNLRRLERQNKHLIRENERHIANRADWLSVMERKNSEINALRKDAERYRFMRTREHEHNENLHVVIMYRNGAAQIQCIIDGEQADSVIDGLIGRRNG